MVGSTELPVPGCGLLRLRRGDGVAAMLEASTPARRREADGWGRPATPVCTCRERPRRAGSRSRTRDVVKSAIYRLRGSRRSRNPSPMRLKPITATAIARPGKNETHHFPLITCSIPSETITPHSGVGM